jgi:hypothetical protein
MPYGMIYKTWLLTDDFELKYIIGSDTGHPTKRKVGNWFLSGDTLNFTIDQKVLKNNTSYLPTGRKYKSFTLKWSGISKIAPAESRWGKAPLNIETIAIFLIDIEKQSMNNIYTDMVRYVEENFYKSCIAIDNKDEIFEINEVVKRLIKDYCKKTELHFKIKTYINGNLMKYL